MFSIQDFLEVKSSTDPSFSPDGSYIAYLSNLSGTHQIYSIAMEGGEAVRLTDFADQVIDKSFSPTNDSIAFSKAENGNENAQLYLLNPKSKEIRSLTNNKNVRYNLGSWSRDGRLLSYSSNERNGKDFDVYVMDIVTGEAKCVYDKGGSCSSVGFSPNTTYLIVKINHSLVNSYLYLCDLRTGVIEPISKHEGDVLHGRPQWLPDESAFFLSMDEGREYKGLASFSLAKRQFEYKLTPEWDVDGVIVDIAGKYLAVTVNEEGYSNVKFYDPYTLKKLSYALPTGQISGLRFSQDGSRAAFSLNDSRRTTDIWTMDMASGECRQITKSPQGVPPEILVEPELIRFTSFDGLSVPAFVYRPRDMNDHDRLPVIISIHGGPEAQYSPVFAPIAQYFVHAGYVVVAPNVRGSSGYGKSYLALDNVEKRLDSVKDIVALRDHMQSFPYVDIDRVVLMGGSYGGFMVLAGLAFYPESWAAGVDIVGIVNFITFLENTAPYRRAIREAEYGSLEKDRELLEKISPISSIGNIKAPLMVIHGANDPRVPLSEAEQVVSRLNALGREVEFIVYPDEGHGLAKLKNRLEAYPRVVDFISRVLGM